MAVTVPPPPYKTPFVDRNGFLSSAWSNWLRQLYERSGGTVALSNTELETLPEIIIDDLQSDVATLQVLTASHTTSIASLQTSVNDLNQGPTL